MTNTSPLLDKLLEDKNKTKAVDPVATSTSRPWAQTQKIISLRYKIYTLIMLLVCWFMWTELLSPAIDRYQQTQSSIQTNERQIVGQTKKLKKYQADQQYVLTIQENEQLIRQCINNKQWCEQLADNLRDNLDVIKAFIQIGNLYDAKMLIDEKSLLMNLDAFMTKRRNEEGKPTIQSNGQIQELVIGDPSKISQELYQVPVDIVVTFPDSDELMSFITNTEDKIIADIQTEVFKSTPVLYRINELAYDIVNYQEEQEVTIKMIAYYYEEK